MRECPSCKYPNPDHFSTCFKCQTPLDESLQPSDSAAPQETILDSSKCAQCEASPEPGGYAMPLCASCRDKLAARPVPLWAITSFAVVLFVLVLSSSRFSESVRAGVAYERGQRAEAAGNYLLAEAQYAQVGEYYPDSTLVLARLMITQCENMNVRGADQTSSKLEGREISKELDQELVSALDHLKSKLRSDQGGNQ